MPLSRLLAIVLLVPFTAFGQNRQNDRASTTQHAPSATTASEPSRILPNDVSKPTAPQDVLSKMQSPFEMLGKSQDQGIILEEVPRTPPPDINSLLPPKDFVASPAGPFIETTCFTMRSYVVARDSKDSDAVHLVHYSTCQPSSRYRVKTIQLHSSPASK